MEISQEYDHFRSKVWPALKSKQEEFQLLGYESVSEEDIWQFLVRKKWRKENNEMKLYEMVQSILSLKVGEFMNYSTVEALKDAEFTLDNDEELLELLK
ncbi:post-transcriptional regulator [Bacillus tuaregi]|uniref:post-transcriptional regulator n=1 Tax=Bacillus tuaregi TaxID=1816695 RepID=UPI0008F7F5A3|nr:post-transcriptional regulator [Bacillus tuaregi]